MIPGASGLVALALVATLAGCLIPEPNANHTLAEAGGANPQLFEEPGPASEPELGVAPAPPPSAAPSVAAAPPASESAANGNEQSSTSGAASDAPGSQTSAPAASTLDQGTSQGQEPPAEPAPAEATPAETDPATAPGEGGATGGETQGGEVQEQDPAPPDLPTEPTTAAGDLKGPPPLATTSPPEVEELLRRYYAAFSAGQWEAAAACFWEGASFTSMFSRSNGETTQVLAMPARDVFAEFISGKRALESVEGQLVGKPFILRSGDVAHAWCRYQAQYGPENDRSFWRRIDSVTLVLHEDTWKIVALAQARSVDRP